MLVLRNEVNGFIINIINYDCVKEFGVGTVRHIMLLLFLILYASSDYLVGFGDFLYFCFYLIYDKNLFLVTIIIVDKFLHAYNII